TPPARVTAVGSGTRVPQGEGTGVRSATRVRSQPMDPAPRAPHPRANLVLALGVAGLVCFGPLTGIPAWILGASAAAEIRREPARYENAGMVTAGMWLGVA